MKKKFELELDGAGYMYPYGATKKRNMVFRVGVVLNHEICIHAFREAVKASYERYPQFFVRFENNFFNYKVHGMHVEHIDFDKLVLEKEEEVAKTLDLSDKTIPAVRFICNGKNVDFECFHGVTDAPGAFMFLGTVLENYISAQDEEFVAQVQTHEEFKEETKDLFKPLARAKTKEKAKISTKSYRFNSQIDGEKYCRTKIKFDTNEILKAAKEAEMGLGAFITGSLMHTMVKHKNTDSKKKIIIVLPVGLRKIMQSSTTRNAALFVEIKQPRKSDELEDTLKSVKRQFGRKVTHDHLAAIAKESVGFEYWSIVRAVPAFIKKIIVNKIEYISENVRYTTCVSSIGRVDFGEKVNAIVDEVVFAVQKPQAKGFNTTLMSYGDTTTFELDSRGNIDFITDDFVTLLKSKVNRVDVEKCEYDY